MRLSILLSLFLALSNLSQPGHSLRRTSVTASSVIVTGQTAGSTPFISQIFLTVSPPDTLKSVQFTISPKLGSVTRPVSATYTGKYLQSRNYLNITTGTVTVPVFGLYANYANTVTLVSTFTDNSSQQNIVTVSTADWTDTCSQFKTPTVLQARTNATDLSYDFILIKNLCGTQSPTIIDTDGAVRWVGTAGVSSLSSIPFANGIYIADKPSPPSSTTGMTRMEFDGAFSFVHDYSSLGVTNSGHHNWDPGKQGMILEVNTTTQTESVLMEVDVAGNVLKTWNLADIISAAMTAGGDDPTQFVHPSPTDWFHNNAATYRKSDDSLLVSSRENFVICLDYQTSAIKWILGDTTKKWYQFPSLRQYALALGPNTLPPIGEHAVSITSDDRLLLFDNGQPSANQSPPGASRTYSAPRKYRLDLQAKVATEEWNYPNGQAVFSPFCSSVYEDSPLNYLVDYARITVGPTIFAEILGLNATGNKIFDYQYTTGSGCNTAWNSVPIHLERMAFTAVTPISAVSRKTHGAAGTYDINLPLNTSAPGIECRGTGSPSDYQVVVTFAAAVTVTGATVSPASNKTASVAGLPSVSGNQVTVNLTNVSNAQTISVNLIGVSDGTRSEDISVPMGVLAGDVNGDGVVLSGDYTAVRQRSGAALDGSTFKFDLNADGFILSGDYTTARQLSGSHL